MIHDLTTQKGRNAYVKSLKTKNSAKEIKTENIYLNRLKEHYTTLIKLKNAKFIEGFTNYKRVYDFTRSFCLDTQLLSFNEIEVMEDEINRSFFSF